MPTGLKFKNSTAAIGGLNIQPVKGKLQSAADPTILKPAALSTSISSNIEISNSISNILQLNAVKTLRAKIIAEKGVNIFRPEIIAATRLEPIYNNETEYQLSNEGEMLETQISARNVRVDNINKFIDSIMQDADTAELLMQLQNEYSNQLSFARDDTKFAIDVYMIVDKMLRRLDIYSDRRQIRNSIVQSLGPNAVVFDLKEIFVDHLGFSSNGFRYFTNTKLFGQLAYDLGTAVRRYTPGLFNIIDGDRPNDVDPLRFDRTVTSDKFSFDMGNFGRKDSTLNAFGVAIFNKFIESLPATSEDKLKLLPVTISRLMGISVALGTTYVQADLNHMNTRLSEDDPIMSAIGLPGQTILDNDFVNKSSLIALTQIVDDSTNETALPFEKRYVISKNDNRYIPGSDYFFDGLMKNENKFDITRFSDFNSTLNLRIKSMMNVVEASSRANTPYAKTIFGNRNDDLQSTTIFNNACATAAHVLSAIDKNDNDSRDFIFILSIFALSQTDKKLRHLLFQLFALTIIFNDLKQVNSTPIEIMNLITTNEISYYGNFPALYEYSALVPVATIQNAEQDENELTPNGQALAQETNIGLTRITATNVVGAAYKHIQELVIDKTFSILAAKTSLGAAQNALKAQQTAIALNQVGVGSTIINFTRPKADQSFDENFRNIMFSIARFADGIEDDASRGGDPGGIKSNRHLIEDKSGRSRYLSTSASTRLMYSFELLSNILGTYGFCQFGGFNINNTAVQIVYNKSKIKSFAKAAMTPFAPVITSILTQFNQAILANNGKLSSYSNSLINQQLFKTYQKVNTGNVNDIQYNEFVGELGGIRNALKLDLDVISSMTQTFRKIALRFDNSVDKAREYFDNYTRKHSKTYNDFVSSVASGKSTRYANTSEINVREIQARRTLISKEQAILSLVRLQDIAEYNRLFSPLNFQTQVIENDAEHDEMKNAFVDDTRVTKAVQDGLLSMFAEPEFRGDKGHATKIISVGIPAGFNDKLEDSDRLEENDMLSQNADRQLDIITVNIHKKDVIEEDIVFKPQRYIFELSRFVSQFSFENSKSKNSQVPINFETLIRENIKMLDFSSLSEQDLSGQIGNEFLSDERYDFMSKQKKLELIKNHVVSFLMGVYIRMMSGLDLREDSFLIEPNAVVLQQATKSIDIFQKVAERIIVLSKLDISLLELRKQFPEFDVLLTSIEAGEFTPGVLEEQQIFDRLRLTKGNVIVSSELTDLARLSSSKSMLTGGEKLRRAITSPKLFERILHVPVDPYEFEIDVEKTMSTRSGAAAYKRLNSQRRLTISKEMVKLKRIKQNADITAEQYFVVLERFESLNKLHTQIKKISKLKQK